ncbi:mobilization protein [Phenylobacterium sp. VNQ135]|uniref:mobilization protein n=1 Tax=Phenylobacterium sp. VNQ135 TaxID=3400922 RepID=UPI003BFF6161
MAKRSIAERLAQLEAQRKTLQTKLSKQERAKDTRRKVLLGAFILYRLEKGQDAFSKEELPNWLRRELPGFITREDDAALFADLLGEPAATTRRSEKGSGAAQTRPPA